MIPHSPTVFESFNARPLRPEQVAKTFIAPSFFRDLSARCHSTVIGPRGSGKTSLLKMLQPRALESWDAQESQDYRESIDFTGVFVPTDISWNRQSTACVASLSSDLARAYRSAAFTTQVLHALIETLCWRTERPQSSKHLPYRRVELSRENERSIAQQLAESWHLKPKTETLLGIKHSLSARNTEVWRSAQEAALLKDKFNDIPSWLALDFLSSVNQAIELFDDAIGETDSRWALLFDELELAPSWIMDGLLTALRSTYPRLLFKLALNPFDEQFDRVRDVLQASSQQDYNEIILWNAKREDGKKFSSRLFVSVCEDQGRTIDEVSDLLGGSLFDDEVSTVPSYSKGSDQWKQLDKAIKSDPSFAAYWKKQGVDLDKIADLSENVRAAKVRKIYPIILLRNYFRAEHGSLQAKRQIRKGRKSLEIYSGAASILAISEGNPRWIIGITRLMLAAAQNAKLPIRSEKQAAILEETVHTFRARLKTISIGPSERPERMATLLSLVDRVGDYFSHELIEAEFRSQPPLSFTLDSNASGELVAGIGRALNAGAIVYVPDKGASALLHDVKGKRFRLSYLLAPFYQLPLRLGDALSLSKIMQEAGKMEGDVTPELPLQHNDHF